MATKTELQETIDSVVEALNETYTPESTREQLAEAVGHALDILNGEDEEDESELDEKELRIKTARPGTTCFTSAACSRWPGFRADTLTGSARPSR